MARVLIPLAKGFEELEAVALIDVMRRGGIEVVIAFLDEKYAHGRVVKGANGIGIQADISLEKVDADSFDMMVLPGGWDGTYALADDTRILSLLQHFKEKKAVGAMCAAPYVLQKAGVLGDAYTCYPQAKEEIAHEGYQADAKVVIDGNVLTSAGPGTAVCFGLEIVAYLVDEKTKEALKEGMLLGYC
jgi:4-methyl-5(b-hydroxyethyl)-thiazole monophosphate biosynthesis